MRGEDQSGTGQAAESIAGLAIKTQLLLERLSGVIEANPGADARTVRVRARLPRRSVDLGLEWLHRQGHVERNRSAGEWQYRSVQPYRAEREAGRGKHYRS